METRERKVYEQGTGKLLRVETYEVSDEEMERERKAERLGNLLEELDALEARVTALEKQPEAI